MNWNQIDENWKQITGTVKKKWGKLTDGDLNLKIVKRKPVAGKTQNTRSDKKDDVEH